MSAATEAPPASMGSAVPSSKGEISVSAMSRSAGAPTPVTATPKPAAAKPAAAAAPAAKAPETTPAAAAQPQKSAKDSMFESLRAKAKNANGAIDPNAAPEAGAAKTPAPGAEDDPEAVAEGGEEGKTTTATAPAAGAEGKKGEKVNPWKLVEQHKATVAAREKEVAELRKLIGDPEARKSEVERLAKIEQRNKELEEQIKFVDYSKSEEFIEKYEKPYEAKWAQVMSDLNEVTVTDPQTGVERAMKPQDMLKLVNMPLNQAMEAAKEAFGDSAAIIMNYRSELKSMFMSKSQALKKAQEEGVTKSKADTERQQAQHKEMQAFASQKWEEAQASITGNEKTGHYFRPIDGEDELNARLEKGYKFVDEVMAMNPFDPKLTPEQRAEVVAKHAAVRARAAGFGRLRAQSEAKDARIAELEKKLAQYEGSEPNTAGTDPAAEAIGQPGSAKQSVFAALRAKAR